MTLYLLPQFTTYEISGHSFPLLKIRDNLAPKGLSNSAEIITQISGRPGLSILIL